MIYIQLRVFDAEHNPTTEPERNEEPLDTFQMHYWPLTQRSLMRRLQDSRLLEQYRPGQFYRLVRLEVHLRFGWDIDNPAASRKCRSFVARLYHDGRITLRHPKLKHASLASFY